MNTVYSGITARWTSKWLEGVLTFCCLDTPNFNRTIGACTEGWMEETFMSATILILFTGMNIWHLTTHNEKKSLQSQKYSQNHLNSNVPGKFQSNGTLTKLHQCIEWPYVYNTWYDRPVMHEYLFILITVLWLLQ